MYPNLTLKWYDAPAPCVTKGTRSLVRVYRCRVEIVERDDATAIEQAAAGEREAFGELVEQFQRTVYAICLRRLGHACEALELTQEVFLHVTKGVVS